MYSAAQTKQSTPSRLDLTHDGTCTYQEGKETEEEGAARGRGGGGRGEGWGRPDSPFSSAGLKGIAE